MSETGKDVKLAKDTGVEALQNALRFEQEKNQVLLDEVVALEDALVNRQMAEFDAVISDATREFWREQLLANREKAEAALRELALAKSGGGQSGGDGDGRRPLHNRATARPKARAADGGQSGAGDGQESTAVRIRNRAHEISKAEGVAFSAAFRRAEREVGGQ